MILTICMVMVLSISKCANDQQTSSFGLAVSDIVIWEREREREREQRKNAATYLNLAKFSLWSILFLKWDYLWFKLAVTPLVKYSILQYKMENLHIKCQQFQLPKKKKKKRLTWLWLGWCKLPYVVLSQFLVLFNDPNQAHSLTTLKKTKDLS